MHNFMHDCADEIDFGVGNNATVNAVVPVNI